MALFHPNNGQDENINIPDEQPNKRDDPEEISAIRIGNGTESCLISVIIPSHDHEAEVDDCTPNEDGNGLMKWQWDDELENGKTVMKRNPVHRDPLGHDYPNPQDGTTVSDNPCDQAID